MRDQFTSGQAQGYADRQSGCEYQPEEDGEEYNDGYENGWRLAGEDGYGADEED